MVNEEPVVLPKLVFYQDRWWFPFAEDNVHEKTLLVNPDQFSSEPGVWIDWSHPARNYKGKGLLEKLNEDT